MKLFFHCARCDKDYYRDTSVTYRSVMITKEETLVIVLQGQGHGGGVCDACEDALNRTKVIKGGGPAKS
jgi:hypothetical protein